MRARWIVQQITHN
jgi:hypothetical protein